jgi:hypothetical protein
VSKISGLPIVASFRCPGVLQHNDPLRALSNVALVALALLMLTAEAKAQSEMFATLEGEIFSKADIRTSTISCAPDPQSTTGGVRIDFSILGTASAPHPGIFNENGFITFDASSGLVTGGKISFAVQESESTTVKGDKVPRDGKASCSTDKATGVTTISTIVPTLDYSATVRAAPDSGKATLDLFASIDKLGLTTLQFTEIFHSSNTVQPSFGKVTGGGNIAQTASGSGVTFGFNAHNTDQGMKGAGTIIDHNAGVKVKILDVTSFSIKGTHATFTGKAEVNGVEEKYQIDVDDLGEPGTGIDSFKIVTDSYGTGGALSGGNLKIH